MRQIIRNLAIVLCAGIFVSACGVAGDPKVPGDKPKPYTYPTS
ncbi:MAG: hypothetical protein AAF352_03865 [Pseudomonadota bacterium]